MCREGKDSFRRVTPSIMLSVPIYTPEWVAKTMWAQFLVIKEMKQIKGRDYIVGAYGYQINKRVYSF